MEYAEIEKKSTGRAFNTEMSPWIVAITEGKIEGEPGRGRSRTPFLKQAMGDVEIRMYRVP